MLRVVLDNSVFVAALLSPGNTSAPNKTLAAWRQQQYTLITGPQILRELVLTLGRRGVSAATLEDLVMRIGSIALYIPGSYEPTRLNEIDPADNIFLAAAYEARADYLVSLDKHLLHLKHFHGTQIRTPGLFVRALS